MELQIIKTDTDYQTLLEWIDDQFDLDLAPESKESQQLQIALLLIKQYEDEHYSIPTPDPIEIVKLKVQENGLNL